MHDFELTDALAAKDFVVDLPLSRVLMNDAKDYPWLLLVPRRNNIEEMHQLNSEDQQQLMREIDLCSRTMERLFNCDRINVAAIGNICPQLHVHIICRYKNDPLWPDVCWNKPMSRLSTPERLDLVNRIRAGFN